MIGLGCMRLSTLAGRDDERSVAVIRAALDAGVSMLDTADAYCLDEHDVGHNERLIARALEGWRGDRSRITVASKGGMCRSNGAWVPDGHAKHLREACEASRRALGVDCIDLYQLHAVDPKTSLETSIRALARLQVEGKVRDVGLCNVNVSQIRAAQSILKVASVQVSLSPFDDESLRNGVAEYCRDHGIRLIAHRPLGGDRVKRLARDETLARLAADHKASVEEVALAWLTSFEGVVPIPGATTVDHATALARVREVRLTQEDRDELDSRFSGRLLRVPRSQRRPAGSTRGEVVIVMGMPGAGKSFVARQLEAEGFERLNRDAIGGSLSGLAALLDERLAAGRSRVVLDNTYPTRYARNEVVEAAWRRGASARCIWLTTDVGQAQINAIWRLIEVHGSLPTPEEIRERGKKDTRYLLPDAQFRYERAVEPPTVEEGFTDVEQRAFARMADSGSARALILDLDDLVGSTALRPGDVAPDAARQKAIVQQRADGWLTFVHAWRPQVARGETTLAEVDACFARLRELLGGEIDVACCPHDAGPPACWCRKPIPG
ncbi:MAG: aldo/keto reductase, partial [Gemmatimonadaceae bacterium]